MAKGEEKIYSKADRVSAKTYLYATRAVLAARWVLDRGTPAPMEFRELADAVLDARMTTSTDALASIQDAFESNSSSIDAIRSFGNCKLFFIDDLGKESPASMCAWKRG